MMHTNRKNNTSPRATLPFRIYLTGFMGSGKSFVGKALANRIGIGFYDLDDLIVEAAGKSIPEIFEQKGEDYFRQIERRCLLQTENLRRAIIATGGGTPCFFDNMECINRLGLSIFLDASPEILIQRLLVEKDQRPLLTHLPDPASFIRQKRIERLPFYEQAHIVYHLDTAEQPVVEDLTQFFGRIAVSVTPPKPKP